MRKANYIAQLRSRLVDLGCPVFQVRRLVQEVADHREDLLRTAVVEGCSASEAEARADGRLGDPLDLAERLTAVVRRSSWWGRHSLIGFGVLPVVMIPVLWGLVLALELWLAYLAGSRFYGNKLDAVNDNAVLFHRAAMAVHCMDYVSVALVTLLFCWLTYRAAASFKWTVTVCAVSSLCALFTCVSIHPHNLWLGFWGAWPVHNIWTPRLIRFAIPLLILGLTYAFQRRTAHRFLESVSA